MTLEEWMRAKGLSDRAMGKLIGISHSIVVRYRTGELRPSWPVLDEILRVTEGAVRPDSFIQHHPWSGLATAEGGPTSPTDLSLDDELDAVLKTQQVA